MRLGVVFAPRHPLATAFAPGDAMRMRDCLGHPLVLPRDGMELRAMIDVCRPRARLDFQAAVETNSIALLKSLLVRGVGVGFLTFADVLGEVKAGKLAYRPLKESQGAVHSLCLITRAGRVLPVAVELLLDAIRPALGSLAPT
jgi:DNA-binding transcriptional LysR family regulator